MLRITREAGALFAANGSGGGEPLLPLSDERFVGAETGMEYTFVRSPAGQVTELHRKFPRRDARAPRLGPLASALKPQTDGDPEATRRVRRALEHLGTVDAMSPEIPYFAEGAQDAYRLGIPELRELQALEFIAEESVADREITRYGARVQRIRYYRLRMPDRTLIALVHFTESGAITDLDFDDD
jgi:hypothetical protein